MSFWIGLAVVVAVILVWGLVADRRRRGGWARGVSDDRWKARDEAEHDQDRGSGWSGIDQRGGQLGAAAPKK